MVSARQLDRSRRRFRRRTVRILVDFVADGRIQCEYATTLGAGGLFVESEAAPDPGTPLAVRFRLLPDGALHEIAARVAWRKAPDAGIPGAPGMGVEFVDSVAAAKLARELETLPD
jgi:Tfp pilus assembly protein PilZ